MRRLLFLMLACAVPALSLAADDTASYAVRGMHFDAEDVPTYAIAPDGSVDGYTAEGYRAYHAGCHGCHGPRGAGSELGGALAVAGVVSNQLQFNDAVVNGLIRRSGGETRVMPAFGTNPRVFCRLDAIFIYLRAETAGVLPGPGAPAATAGSDAQPAEDLAACLGE